VPQIQGTVITYCTNIHPAETWSETERNLRAHLPAVKRAVSPDAPFPIGLWLPARAAFEIDEGSLRAFGEWCRQEGLFVPAINGFPYGRFHGAAVKEKVYLPDWRSPERADYTRRLAELLAGWLPEGMAGSVSTVPVGFRREIRREDLGLVRSSLILVLEHLDRIGQASGKEILLALEPEPGCYLETTGDAVLFFERLDLPENLRGRIGLCLDCCHLAVEFEEPAQALGRLADAGIRLGKVQLSSALRLRDVDPQGLARFCEPTYLHQTVIRGPDGTLSRYDDLPEALQRHRAVPGEEWRVHFHVPLFLDGREEPGTTRFFVEELLPLLGEDILLEVETYTWEILPPELRGGPVTEAIAREIRWAQAVKP
jgi:sugar phosphate isomerase/epimerase